jgi:hypothetical protein
LFVPFGIEQLGRSSFCIKSFPQDVPIGPKKFQGILFGDFQSGWWSPLAIKYKDIFLKEDGKTMNGAMEKVVDGIIGILEWIEANKDNLDEFHHVGIEARLQQCVNDWKKIAADQKENGSNKTKYLLGLAKLDFGELRIMLVVQICCLAKIVVTGHANLNNLVYPVSGLRARNQLSHLKDSSDRWLVVNTIVHEMEMEEYGTNAAEGLLCETSLNPVEGIWDYVFYGIMLFRICKEGKNWLKVFGSSEWEEF